MKSTSVRFFVMLAVTMFVLSTVNSAEAKLFGRLCGNSCCEEAAPCCEAPAPCCEADPCCKKGCFLGRLFNRNKCCEPACEPTCCEETTCCEEPAPCCEEVVVEAAPVVEDCGCAEPAPCCEEPTCCEETCCKPSLCERIKCKLQAHRAKRCGCGC